MSTPHGSATNLLAASFKVQDGRYGLDSSTRRAASGRTTVFRPHILAAPVPDDLSRCAGIFARVSRDPDSEIVTLVELHRRRMQAHKAACPDGECVEREEARVAKMDQLRAWFNAEVLRVGFPRAPKEAFNRWLFESLVVETVSETLRDPLIPGDAARLSQGMLDELLDDAMKTEPLKSLPDPQRRELCEGVCVRLAEKAARFVDELAAVNRTALTRVRHAQQRKLSSYVSFSLGSVEHEILAGHAEKFAHLFTAYNPGTSKVTCADRIFAMLQRYRSLAGFRPGQEGSGHHSATPPQVLDTFRRVLGVQYECFASPFNSHFAHFCTAFGDTDGYFGSLGSFFNFFPVEGSFEVGPPFVEELMHQMHAHLVSLLCKSSRPLSFVMIVPDWVHCRQQPSASLSAIVSNVAGFTRRVIIVPRDQHTYLDGFQHCLRDSFFKPVHDTLALIMQNDAGAAKWPATPAVERAVLDAWADVARDIADNSFYSAPGGPSGGEPAAPGGPSGGEPAAPPSAADTAVNVGEKRPRNA